jgi:hypothetical protein
MTANTETMILSGGCFWARAGIAAVADLAVQFDDEFEFGDRGDKTSFCPVDHRYVVSGNRLASPVSDLPLDG